MGTIKKLDEEQVYNFDTDYIQGADWVNLVEHLNKSFPDGEFSFIDVGGGNGVFCDKLLETFPKSKGVLIDNSEYLINLNKENPRKTIICDSVENINKLLPDEKFDVIFLNLVLHHFIGNSYKISRSIVENTLNNLYPLLSDRGLLYIMEDVYNGKYIDGLASYLIFSITSIKALGGITRRLGANTGGVGVCFRSRKQWLSLFDKCGYKVDKEDISHRFNNFPFYKRFILHMGDTGMVSFWLEKK